MSGPYPKIGTGNESKRPRAVPTRKHEPEIGVSNLVRSPPEKRTGNESERPPTVPTRKQEQEIGVSGHAWSRLENR